MIKIGSIKRWQHLGPFISEGRMLKKLVDNERIALNSDRRARNKIYRLFNQLSKTPYRKRMDDNSYPAMIQEILYYSVYEYELREIEAKIEEQHKTTQEIMRNSKNFENSLELVLAEDRERELRSELHKIANDEGVKHFLE